MLCAPAIVCETVLQRKLEHVVQALLFYYGPLTDIRNRCTSKAEYKEVLQQIFSKLTPLATHFHMAPSELFDPIPYTELPLVCNLFM